MSPGLVLLVVVSANVLGAAMTLPQAVRLVRTRRTEGVSVSWAAMSVTGNAWWIAYAAGSRSWAVVPVAAVSVAGYAVILTVLLAGSGRRGAGRTTGAVSGRWSPLASAAVAGTAMAPAAALIGGGWGAVGVVLGLVYGAQLAPAVLAAHRATDLSGVSVATWAVAWAEAVLWGAYGVDGSDGGLVVLGVVGAVAATAVLVRVLPASAAAVRSSGSGGCPSGDRVADQRGVGVGARLGQVVAVLAEPVPVALGEGVPVDQHGVGEASDRGADLVVRRAFPRPGDVDGDERHLAVRHRGRSWRRASRR